MYVVWYMHIDSTLLINSKIYQKYNNLTKKTHIFLSWTQAKIDCHRFQRRIPSISPTSHKPFSDRWSVRPVGFKIVSRYSWSIETIAATSTRRGVAHNFVAFPTDTRPYQSSHIGGWTHGNTQKENKLPLIKKRLWMAKREHSRRAQCVRIGAMTRRPSREPDTRPAIHRAPVSTRTNSFEFPLIGSRGFLDPAGLIPSVLVHA